MYIGLTRCEFSRERRMANPLCTGECRMARRDDEGIRFYLS